MGEYCGWKGLLREGGEWKYLGGKGAGGEMINREKRI